MFKFKNTQYWPCCTSNILLSIVFCSIVWRLKMGKYIKYLSVVAFAIGLNSPLHAGSEHDSTELGSIIGTVLGGVVGYQFGGGSGKYVSTAVGAAIGSNMGRNIHHNQNQKHAYQADYFYPAENDSYQNSYHEQQSNYQQQSSYHQQQNSYHHQAVYAPYDDFLIKQQLSDAAKRRNMIRNGEIEQPYDVSNVQTSWDDPDN